MKIISSLKSLQTSLCKGRLVAALQQGFVCCYVVTNFFGFNPMEGPVKWRNYENYFIFKIPPNLPL